MPRDQRILWTVSVVPIILLSAAFALSGGSSRIIAACLLLPSAIAIFCLVKKRSIPSIYSRTVTLLLAVIGALFVMAVYLTGISEGFYQSPYTTSLSVIPKYILPVTVIIASSEVIRVVLLAQERRYAAVCAYITCVLSDVLICSNLAGIHNFNAFMDLVAFYFFPAVVTNLLYHYLSHRYGVYPGMAYRLISTLYLYVIPVLPNTPDALFAFFKLIIPIPIYFFISALYEKKRSLAVAKRHKWEYAVTVLIFAAMVSVVMLISCQFRYGMLVVGSGSMEGELHKGDAVIFEADEDRVIQKNDIIIFEKDGARVIHRVVDVQCINSQNRYTTKGDANDHNDQGYVTDAQIVGVADFKIPYLGYPTIWLRDIFH